MAAGFWRSVSWACILGLQTHILGNVVVADPISDTQWTEDVLGRASGLLQLLWDELHSWLVPGTTKELDDLRDAAPA